MKPEKRIILCLAHMSGNEERYIKEAFETNWVVPLGPNVNGFEDDLKRFIASTDASGRRGGEQAGAGEERLAEGSSVRDFSGESYPQSIRPHEDDPGKLWPVGNERLKDKQVVALASGTAAVHLALVGLGVGPGDEVICQSFTFCASSHPVTYLGAKPVFVDSERETWNMDPCLLEEAIRDRMQQTGRKPKAIIVVYLYGMPAKINEIKAVADRYGIPLVEDAAEGLGSRYRGQVCGTFGEYGVLSFNGNKMITTSGGGALVCPDEAARNNIMFYATQAREGYPYYQHEKIGYNYRMSNICAGIGRGQMTVVDEHIAHHRHIARLYAEAFAGIEGIEFHDNPSPEMDSNFWLNTITLSPSLRVRGQENAYKATVKSAVGGAAGVIHFVDSAHTDCEPNTNVEAMRVWLDQANIESRPLWKPMHKQPCYKDCVAYANGVSEELFRVGMCLPSGPLVGDEEVDYIVESIKQAIV
ncbi:MAG: DegT/DnrJ/EryC1/StrS family aminotransferase [Prevotella sp.]|nr:DegT/DnrJ/EryC1/StrS family aminotransferase [Prevotella sp.]